MRHLGFALLALFFSLIVSANEGNTIRVVTTIAPIQSLVSGVMQGVATPTAIVSPGTSEHTYSLSPSEALTISQADVIFWVNDDIENFFPRIIRSLSPKQQVVKLIEAPGLLLLEKRSDLNWEAHDHDHDHGHDEESEHHKLDGHIWLDPVNASHLVAYIAAKLSAADPSHAIQYQTNALSLQAELKTLDSQVQQQLNPIKNKPYWVFHDAYHYFENRYQLNAKGAISINPEQPLSAKRVQQLREKILQDKIQCVFSEPQFLPAIVHTITEKTGVRNGVLDPIGADSSGNATDYFKLIHQLNNALITCLQA